MALTADRTDRQGKVHGRTQEAVILDTNVIFRGAMVVWNNSTPATLEAATDAASKRFAGVAIRGGTGNAAGTVLVGIDRRVSRFFTLT